MKKIATIILAIAMVFSTMFSQSAYASYDDDNVGATTEIRPYGSLRGSTAVNFVTNTESSRIGSCTVTVSGTPWTTAQAKFTVKGFNSATTVSFKLYNPDGSLVWDTLSTAGPLSGGSTAYKVIRPGSVGEYTVKYKISTIDGSILPQGSFICDIY